MKLRTILIATSLSLPVVMTPTQVVEADHKPCAGIYDLRGSQDRFAAYCQGLGENGWFHSSGFCYSIVWVVENGVVVDTIYTYGGPYFGPNKYKASFEQSDESTMVCPVSKPFIAKGVPGLNAWIVYWH
jgi:hypothetical protein